MIKKKLVVTNGSYVTQGGQEKKRYKTIGHLHEGQHGHYITLDASVNLAAFPRKDDDDRVFVNLYDHEARQAREQTQHATGGDGFEDKDLPF